MRPLGRVSRWVTITKIFIVVTTAIIFLGGSISFQENIGKVIKKEKECEVSLRGGLGFSKCQNILILYSMQVIDGIYN